MKRRHNPYQKKKGTHLDPKLMERIGWSEEEIAAYLDSYSTFDQEEEEEEEEQQQQKKASPCSSRVQKVEVPVAVAAAAAKVEAKGKKVKNEKTVVEDV